MHTLPLEPSHDTGSPKDPAVPKDWNSWLTRSASSYLPELPDVKAEEKLDPWFVIDRLRHRVGDDLVTFPGPVLSYVPGMDKWLYWSDIGMMTSFRGPTTRAGVRGHQN